MLIPPEAFAGWKVTTVGDDIAWIKPGADGRLLRDQSRGRLLRRGAGHHPTKSNPNAMATMREEHHLHQRGADRRRRRLVGRHDQRAAGAPDRLAGQGLDAGDAEPGKAAHPNARFTAPAAQCPVHRPGMGKSQGRAHQRLRLRRAARRRDPAGLPGLNWITASSWRRPWARKRPRPPRAPSARCAATRSPCCPSAAITWPTTSTTGSKIGRAGSATAAHFLRQLVPQGRGRQVLWPGFGENIRVLKWIVERANNARPRPSRARSDGCRATRTLAGRAG